MKKIKYPVKCLNCGNTHDYSNRLNLTPETIGLDPNYAGVRIYSISVCPKCKKQGCEVLEVH